MLKWGIFLQRGNFLETHTYRITLDTLLAEILLNEIFHLLLRYMYNLFEIIIYTISQLLDQLIDLLLIAYILQYILFSKNSLDNIPNKICIFMISLPWGSLLLAKLQLVKKPCSEDEVADAH